MITFSIVTITYNAADVLQRTLDSVAMQTYGAIEHVIVDGASTDSTVAMARRYAEATAMHHAGRTVRIVSEPDSGLYDAMNKGLAMARGTYVCFLNAGDALAQAGTLQLLARTAVAAIGNNSGANSGASHNREALHELPAVLYGDTNWVDNGGHYLSRRHLAPPERLTWRSFRHGMLVCHQAFFARTDVAGDIKYDLRYRFSADVDWCIRVMREAERRHLALANSHATIINYLREGMTTINRRASLKERYHIMCRHYGTPCTMVMHVWFVLRAVLRLRRDR